MALALNNLKRVDMPLNKETNQPTIIDMPKIQTILYSCLYATTRISTRVWNLIRSNFLKIKIKILNNSPLSEFGDQVLFLPAGTAWTLQNCTWSYRPVKLKCHWTSQTLAQRFNFYSFSLNLCDWKLDHHWLANEMLQYDMIHN